MNDRSKARGILSDSRFPEADHTPSRRLQFPALFEVASHVPFNLGDPIIRVVTTREASFPPFPVASSPWPKPTALAGWRPPRLASDLSMRDPSASTLSRTD